MRFLKNAIILILVLFFAHGCEFKSNDQALDPSLSYELKDINNGRSVWQKPGLVIEKLGDVSDKVIADIGAGTGYFSFRFAFKAKKVLAIDIDPQMLQLIEAFKTNLPKDLENKIETRLSESNDPLLKNQEADIVFIMNTITYIEKPLAYLKLLKPAISDEGKIMIVDFKTSNIEISAPPKDERMEMSKLVKLLEAAGYKNIEVDNSSLKYQYIITANKE